jgi:hypothetical protein
VAWKTKQAMEPIVARIVEMHERGEKREVMAAELGYTMAGLYYHIRKLKIQRPVNRPARGVRH